MKKYLYFIAMFAFLSCKKKEADPVPANPTPLEYENWYVLKSPIDRPIEGVWGNYNKTLLITTKFSIHRSTDQGKNWQSVYEVASGNSAVFGIVQHQDTLFTMHAKANGSYGEFFTNATLFSIDDGKNWQVYRKYNSFFDLARYRSGDDVDKSLRVDQVRKADGIFYKIYRDFLDDPAKQSGRFETPGVISSNGQRIDLPQIHQLNSVYLDTEERIYIVGGDAVCSKDGKFAYCNSKGGRGVLYVSKRPLPW